MRNANVALLQLCSGDQVRDNLAQIEQQIKQLNAGVKLVMTPENALLFANSAAYRQQAENRAMARCRTRCASWRAAMACGCWWARCP